MSSDSIEIKDRLAIQDVLSGYCHAMDASRADLCIDLFTDDAALQTPVGDRKGRAGILEWIEGRLALRAPEYQVGHYMLNSLMTRLSPNSVKVRSMFLYTRQRRDGSSSAELLGAGLYEDEVRKEPAGWRFSSRRFTMSAPLDDAFFSR
jgi:hypothetical protein